MRVVVTGGAGYVGSVVTAMLAERGHAVTVLDNLSTGHLDAVHPDAQFRMVDLLDRPAALTALGPEVDAVVHCAGLSLVGESMRAPVRYFRDNVTAAVNLLDAMRAYGIGTFVFSSTAAVYGEPDVVPIPEDAPTRPGNAYGASKLAIDQLLRFEALSAGVLAPVSLRYFNVAGAYGPYRERHATETHLIPNLLAAAAGRGTFTMHGDGSAVRDYVHVADLAEAHLLALEAARPGEHRVFNLGNGRGHTVGEVVEAARRVTGREIAVQGGPARPGDPARLVASSGRALDELGWEPKRTGLDDIVGDAWQAMEVTTAATGCRTHLG